MTDIIKDSIDDLFEELDTSINPVNELKVEIKRNSPVENYLDDSFKEVLDLYVEREVTEQVFRTPLDLQKVEIEQDETPVDELQEVVEEFMEAEPTPVDELQEVVEEFMEAEPTPQMSPMDIIVNNLSKTIKKETEESPSIELNEQTVINMQKQIIDLRRMINEALGGRNMVSGIGQGGDGQSPGSGEVEVNLMDDVEVGPHASELQDGDVLVWDSSGRNGMGCWRPGKLNPSPSECLSIDGGESNNNFFDGQYPNRLDGSTASGSTQTESNYDTGNSSTTVCAGTISSDDQLFTAIDQLKVRLAEVESYVSVAVE